MKIRPTACHFATVVAVIKFPFGNVIGHWLLVFKPGGPELKFIRHISHSRDAGGLGYEVAGKQKS